LPQISILGTRYPDSRKTIFQQQLQQKSGILAVGLLLPYSLGLDLRSIADPTSMPSATSNRSNYRE
jgi:hypothetical protein